MDTGDLIRELLLKTKLAVISTVGEVSPESAVLEFGQTDTLELVFDTLNTSRKYKNLQRNPNVSFVIGWDDSITIQYEGTAREVRGDELEKCKDIYFLKNPEAKKWANKEGINYFLVSPRWIRYSDLNKHPWDIKELTF